LKQCADPVPVADICRKTGISSDLFQLEDKYDAVQPSEMRRLKALEDENAKLKKIVALDREMLQPIRPVSKLGSRRFARRAFAMAIGGCTPFFAVKAGM
jgi:putative transposase